MQEQAASSIAANSLLLAAKDLPAQLSNLRSKKTKIPTLIPVSMESDDEIRRVPEIGSENAGTSARGGEAGVVAGPNRVQASAEGPRKRGRSPADKENKRLKSIGTTSEGEEEAYLIELEARVKDLEKKNSELEERVSTLQNENQMLRHVSSKSHNTPIYNNFCVIIIIILVLIKTTPSE
ncbi:unnamed protein product, partial [Thlaspi arvense]